MNTPIRLRNMFGGLACALALGACGTSGQVAKTAPKLEDMMTQAVAASSAGNKEIAVGLWQQAATAYPADKEPWLRVAETKYEAGRYGEAITNAQEVLVRDPADKKANSIIAISGLRLSTRALSDLSRQNNLSGDIRVESQDLAKLLRESLGETVLFPQNKLTPPPLAAKPARAARGVKPAGRQGAAATSANPFDGLK